MKVPPIRREGQAKQDHRPPAADRRWEGRQPFELADARPETAEFKALQRMIENSPQQRRLRGIRATMERGHHSHGGMATGTDQAPSALHVVQRNPWKGLKEKKKQIQVAKAHKTHELEAKLKSALQGLLNGGLASLDGERAGPFILPREHFEMLYELGQILGDIRLENHPRLERVRRAVSAILSLLTTLSSMASDAQAPGVGFMVNKMRGELDKKAKEKLEKNPKEEALTFAAFPHVPGYSELPEEPAGKVEDGIVLSDGSVLLRENAVAQLGGLREAIQAYLQSETSDEHVGDDSLFDEDQGSDHDEGEGITSTTSSSWHESNEEGSPQSEHRHRRWFPFRRKNGEHRRLLDDSGKS